MATHSKIISSESREYPLNAFSRYFVYVIFTGLIGLFCWLGYDMSTDTKSNIPGYIIVVVAVLLISGSIYLILRAYKEKLIIEADRFVHVMVYSSRTIYLDEVKGFKVDKDYIHIIPIQTDGKKINITTYIARSDELKLYLTNNFTNLDLVEYEEQLNDILTDSSLGFTEEEREQKLKKAKLISKVINWPSYVIAALLFFHPTPYLILMTVAVIWPLLAIAALKSNRLIRFDEETNSPYPNITFGFFMPLAGLTIRLVGDLSLVGFDNIWLPSAGLFIILLLVLQTGNRSLSFSSGKKTGVSILLVAFIFLYCLAASVSVNCLYDKATPTEYRVKVVSKHISRGKSTSYNLVLEKWGTQTEGEQEMVSYELYNRTQIGDSVTVGCRPGILGAPWYMIY